MNGSEEREIKELKALVRKGRRVVDDFLPNIANCALQRYDELNDFMIESDMYMKEQDDDEKT